MPQMLAFTGQMADEMKIVNRLARRATLHSLRTPAFFAPAVLAIGLVAGCTPTIDQQGHPLDHEMVSEIQPGVTTKTDVTRALGTPSSVSTFDPNTWYYISKRTEQSVFSGTTLLDQQVVVITFDDAGTVKDIQQRSKDDARDVSMIPRTTPASGREYSVIEQLIGNLGKFDTGNGPKK
jgi:outer membrane protein assembly factor BamE (lipoprotein component of BamABCDE complex)